MTAIYEAFCPRVLVYSTDEVNAWLQDTIHLPDVATLLKPWQTAGVERVSVRTSTFESLNLPTFPLRIDAAASALDERADWEGGWLDSLSSEMQEHTEQWLVDTPIDSRQFSSGVRELKAHW
jgi:hypothetical protein